MGLVMSWQCPACLEDATLGGCGCPGCPPVPDFRLSNTELILDWLIREVRMDEVYRAKRERDSGGLG
jgi:hypothetical protein